MIIINTLLAILYVIGHIALLCTIANRWILRIADNPLKPLIYAIHALVWTALPLLTLQWLGVANLVDALLCRLPSPAPVFCLWLWLMTGVGLYSIVSALSGRRAPPVPAEQTAASSHIEQIDRSLLTGLSSRILARGDLARVEILHLTLALPRLPDAFDGFVVAHLTDFHYGGEISQALLAVARKHVQSADPDIVALTGDFVTYEAAIEPCVHATAAICAGQSAYAVFGNHDSWARPEKLQAALENEGVTILRNRALRIEREGASLCICGVDDYWSETEDLDAALTNRRDDEFCLLLAHNPDHVTRAARRNVDLQLSGHTHGGQVVLPLFGPLIVPSEHGRRFVAGLYKVGETLLYVNRGLAMHPQLRIGSIPQVTFLTLTAAPLDNSQDVLQ